MSDMDKNSHDFEEQESKNIFNKYLYKAMSFLGLTSGVGLVAIGGYWFIYSLLQYIFIEPESAIQQIVTESYFSQAQMGVVIVALGVLIMAVKKVDLK